jgi:hypothetical protein
LTWTGPGGEATLQQFSGGKLPPTLEFTSGRDNSGRGLLYGIPPGVQLKTTPMRLGKKEELRFQAKGAQTVLPPSRHETGSLYAWVPGRGPGEIEAALAPKWLLEQLRPGGPKSAGRKAPALADGEPISDGARDDTLASLAGSMRRRGMSKEGIEAGLLAENEQRCDPPLPDEQVRKIAESIARYPPGPANDGTSVILASFKEKYHPLFRRGNALYSDALSREVRPSEACFGPSEALIAQLATAADAPQNEYGVNQGALPGFFKKWAPVAWTTLLDGLPEEGDSEEISLPAQEEFRGKIAAALLTMQSFTYTYREGKEERREVQRRSLLSWCESWAKPGHWQAVRSLPIWTRKDENDRLCVALRFELFQVIGKPNPAATKYRFPRLAEIYEVGVAQRVGRSRAVELAPEFLLDLLAQPDVAADVGAFEENPSRVRAREEKSGKAPT